MDLSWQSTKKFAEKALYTWWLWFCGYVIIVFFILAILAILTLLFSALGL